MEEEGGRGLRMSKRFNNGEVDYKTKSGTAWSHSYLNQKPWHPLSYPNQRRKWIAEQSDAHNQKRAEQVSREYAQEQEFFRQTALISKKEKEKIEMMKAVSFMYVRPPGYNPESAKAAEIADDTKQQYHPEPSSSQPAMLPDSTSGRDTLGEEKKKSRPKDVFGRSIPTAEEFEVLKNAPRLETGVAARAKPFGIEIRNVKCIRCSNYGHQSGDRECPLKDAIMPNEESRLKRDDPLTSIVAQMDPSEPLKWELKQKPGMSPPRGGFDPDNPNQQIVAEDIFDEYGGFLSGNIPELLTTFPLMKSTKKSKKHKQKHKRHPSPSREVRAPEEDGLSSSSDYEERRLKKAKTKKQPKHSESSSSDDLKFGRHSKKSRHKDSYSSDDLGCSSPNNRSKRRKRKHPHSSEDSGYDKRSKINNSRQKHFRSFKDADSDERRRSKNHRKKHPSSYEQSSPDKHHKYEKKQKKSYRHSSDDSEYDRCCASKYGSHHHH